MMANDIGFKREAVTNGVLNPQSFYRSAETDKRAQFHFKLSFSPEILMLTMLITLHKEGV